MGIVASVLRVFHGGVHPPDNKDISQHCAIEPLAMPKRLYVPLHQHIGAPCQPCVKAGDTVKKGQIIGTAAGFISAPVHAPTSGTIVAVEEHLVGHPSGLKMLCAVLDTDGEDVWVDDLETLDDPLHADPKTIRDKIRAAGIVGLGGASFPSFVKMSPPDGKVVELLLINGVECEPYLTCDARLMEERSQDLIEGIEIMLRALQCKECVIGIEDNKPNAISVMQKASAQSSSIKVVVLPVMYPQGSEKQLIEVVTGRQVPSGKLPLDAGVIVHNVATAVAIRDGVKFGKPLIQRLVTVTGRGINRPANLEVLMGTPVRALVDHCGGLKPGVKKVINGGPMMGTALQTLDVPVVKGTSGILCMMADDVEQNPEHACIRCGSCVQVCPISLVPSQMAWLAKYDQFDTLPDNNLADCIECGTCAYVCPSNIPLVHYFRYGKNSLAAIQKAEQRSALDKSRVQAKEARVAAEKAEKERKKAEMKAKMAEKMAAKKKAEAEAAAATPAVDQDASKTTDEPAIAHEPATTTTASAATGDDDKAARAARAAKAAKAARAAKAAKAARAAKAAKETADQ
ncbi:MAG: electron transport complex subunit RsxC [Magnetococcales bacterium]|nr:electron transport complex subunit RsxC [Magnetococcales bacterium]